MSLFRALKTKISMIVLSLTFLHLQHQVFACAPGTEAFAEWTTNNWRPVQILSNQGADVPPGMLRIFWHDDQNLCKDAFSSANSVHNRCVGCSQNCYRHPSQLKHNCVGGAGGNLECSFCEAAPGGSGDGKDGDESGMIDIVGNADPSVIVLISLLVVVSMCVCFVFCFKWEKDESDIPSPKNANSSASILSLSMKKKSGIAIEKSKSGAANNANTKSAMSNKSAKSPPSGQSQKIRVTVEGGEPAADSEVFGWDALETPHSSRSQQTPPASGRGGSYHTKVSIDDSTVSTTDSPFASVATKSSAMRKKQLSLGESTTTRAFSGISNSHGQSPSLPLSQQRSGSFHHAKFGGASSPTASTTPSRANSKNSGINSQIGGAGYTTPGWTTPGFATPVNANGGGSGTPVRGMSKNSPTPPHASPNRVSSGPIRSGPGASLVLSRDITPRISRNLSGHNSKDGTPRSARSGGGNSENRWAQRKTEIQERTGSYAPSVPANKNSEAPVESNYNIIRHHI